MFTVDRLLDAREARLVRLELLRAAPAESVKQDKYEIYQNTSSIEGNLLNAHSDINTSFLP